MLGVEVEPEPQGAHGTCPSVRRESCEGKLGLSDRKPCVPGLKQGVSKSPQTTAIKIQGIG